MGATSGDLGGVHDEFSPSRPLHLKMRPEQMKRELAMQQAQLAQLEDQLQDLLAEASIFQDA